jgi:hypothetical protein
MTETQRLEIVSGIIAQPENVDQLRLELSNVSEYIDPHRNPTSNNPISHIIAHRQYDAVSG